MPTSSAGQGHTSVESGRSPRHRPTRQTPAEPALRRQAIHEPSRPIPAGTLDHLSPASRAPIQVGDSVPTCLDRWARDTPGDRSTSPDQLVDTRQRLDRHLPHEGNPRNPSLPPHVASATPISRQPNQNWRGLPDPGNPHPTKSTDGRAAADQFGKAVWWLTSHATPTR